MANINSVKSISCLYIQVYTKRGGKKNKFLGKHEDRSTPETMSHCREPTFQPSKSTVLYIQVWNGETLKPSNLEGEIWSWLHERHGSEGVRRAMSSILPETIPAAPSDTTPYRKLIPRYDWSANRTKYCISRIVTLDVLENR